MKKIILTLVLSSLLPALAVAEDKKMQNTNPNPSAPLMEGKHMMNSNPNASVLEGKHLMKMGDNPYSSHPSKSKGSEAAKTNDQTKKGYSVVKYKK